MIQKAMTNSWLFWYLPQYLVNPNFKKEISATSIFLCFIELDNERDTFLYIGLYIGYLWFNLIVSANLQSIED